MIFCQWRLLKKSTKLEYPQGNLACLLPGPHSFPLQKDFPTITCVTLHFWRAHRQSCQWMEIFLHIVSLSFLLASSNDYLQYPHIFLFPSHPSSMAWGSVLCPNSVAQLASHDPITCPVFHLPPYITCPLFHLPPSIHPINCSSNKMQDSSKLNVMDSDTFYTDNLRKNRISYKLQIFRPCEQISLSIWSYVI